MVIKSDFKPSFAVVSSQLSHLNQALIHKKSIALAGANNFQIH